MLADKRPKTAPIPQFMAPIAKFISWLSTPVVLEDDYSDWYAGLCVDPRGFSEQLGKLQTSLGRVESSANVASQPRA
jgi:hypothetical protein